MNYKFDAIIWDCDGVLMDSEIISVQTSVDFFKSYGINVTVEDYINRFIGRRIDDKISVLEKESGIPLSKLITKEALKNTKQKKLENFKKYLKSTKGIEEVLGSINLPMAVASGGSTEKLNYTLELLKLKPFFNGNIFSSDLVEHGKPSPDVFLYAADKLGVNPKRCLVIEDGISGIKGAKEAGMSVYAFTGGSHINEDLKNRVKELSPDVIFDDMLKLLDIIKS